MQKKEVQQTRMLKNLVKVKTTFQLLDLAKGYMTMMARGLLLSGMTLIHGPPEIRYRHPVIGSSRRTAANIMHTSPDPTRYSVRNVDSPLSVFQLFMKNAIFQFLQQIQKWTNKEGARVQGQNWRDVTDSVSYKTFWVWRFYLVCTSLAMNQFCSYGATKMVVQFSMGPWPEIAFKKFLAA